MSIYKNGKLIAGGRQCMPLLSFMWADHVLNDASWLRADTFSWQSGSVYQAVYAHLTSDITGKALQSETISGTTIQFYLADDGHKICPASQESNVTAIYNATGVAWYYIIDTINQRFKLPRTKFGFTGIRNGVGGFVNAGLPNITGTIGGRINTLESPTSSGAFTTTYNVKNALDYAEDNSWTANFAFDASHSSSIYGNSDTVQPKATEMYLYFYVGQFTQAALENTAGVVTEDFNELNAHKVIAFQEPTAGNGYTWYRKYADGWVEQGGYVAANAGTTAVVVNLAISMANADYSVIGQVYEAYTGTSSGGINFYDKTITTFKLNKNNSNRQVWWQVSGMAAN